MMAPFYLVTQIRFSSLDIHAGFLINLFGSRIIPGGVMDVFKTIEDQMDAMEIPLFAVTLTALPRSNTPLLLMLHWHGYNRQDSSSNEIQPIPSSAVQLNERWLDMGDLDRTMLDAAWQLGAWQLEREEKRSCMTIGAPDREFLEFRQAFGDDPFGEKLTILDAPDREDMMKLGARVGYVRWQFRPVRGGVWKDSAKDDSLTSDGSRRLPCPFGVKALVGTSKSMTRYKLGCIESIVLP
jgi:hypothetical protein